MALRDLNPQQRLAVETTDGPVLVLAGAGTGKTRVVTERIAHLLGTKGVPPGNITAVTFTNKAAREMKERARKLVRGARDVDDMFVGTFHSFCLRMLRSDAERLGYRPRFSVCGQGEQMSIVRKALRETRGAGSARPDDVVAAISRLKTAGVDARAARRNAVEERDHLVATAYRKYVETLRLMNAMDFDDLLLNALALLRDHAEVRDRMQDRARYLMVDEFQDTNDIQFELVRLLAGKHGNICVVGDDDQSIYSWRGARPGNITGFDSIFHGAAVIRLEENYRSVNTILRASNAVIANNGGRVEKSLWSSLGDGGPVEIMEAEDEEEEARRVVERIGDALSDDRVSAGDFAILVRANAQTRPFEEELRICKIPCVVIGGQSFFDRKEVRDVMSYLAVAAHPRDDAACLRIVNTPARGIGAKALEAITAFAQKRDIAVSEAVARAGEIPGLSAAARRGAEAFTEVVRECREDGRDASGMERLVDRLLERIDYMDEIERLYDNPLDRAARWNSARDVGSTLRAFAERNADADLSGFLQESAVVGREEADEKEKALGRDAVRIITLHSAKGLEFPHVFLVGMQEGLLPHKNAVELGDIDEERRLAYVGMTRAQQSLVLTRAKRRTLRGKPVETQPSRFLAEIPEDCLKTRDRVLSQEEVLAKMREMQARLRERT